MDDVELSSLTISVQPFGHVPFNLLESLSKADLVREFTFPAHSPRPCLSLIKVMAGVQQRLYLRPFLVESGNFDKLVESGQTLSTNVSPLDDSVAVYMKNTVSSSVLGAESSISIEHLIEF
jgi:hypothetical protein